MHEGEDLGDRRGLERKMERTRTEKDAGERNSTPTVAGGKGRLYTYLIRVKAGCLHFDRCQRLVCVRARFVVAGINILGLGLINDQEAKAPSKRSSFELEPSLRYVRGGSMNVYQAVPERAEWSISHIGPQASRCDVVIRDIWPLLALRSAIISAR